MRPARELLEDKLVWADGAMGTYYAQLAARDADVCERANVTNPELIRRIHQEYLAAGARLLRTNTFAAAALFGMSDPAGLKEVVSGGFKLAVACAGNLAFVAADCGPAYNLDPEAAVAAERIVVDTFLKTVPSCFFLKLMLTRMNSLDNVGILKTPNLLLSLSRPLPCRLMAIPARDSRSPICPM